MNKYIKYGLIIGSIGVSLYVFFGVKLIDNMTTTPFDWLKNLLSGKYE